MTVGTERIDVQPAPGATTWTAAFAYRDFNLYGAARILVILGGQMQSVAVDWQVYALTGRPLDLAWVGLALFLPAVGLALVTGHAADRFERRRILMACNSALAAMCLALFLLARTHHPHVLAIYSVLIGVGTARAFQGPANQAMLPTLVRPEHFGNAVAWGSSFWQFATIAGPTLGGIVYASTGGAAFVYATSAVLSLVAAVLLAFIQPHPQQRRAPPTDLHSLLAGVRYIASSPIVLGATSLDLFAVLLGGATALLPAYARDILHLGPWALGLLRSAPAIGGGAMGIALALRPLGRHVGRTMFLCVALFGLGTIVFGESRNFILSLGALVVLGAADMVSVCVRAALVQLSTPDAMRGRVSAINMLFIGASNELGEFESGVTAQWFGVVPAVVLGGFGTLLVVALWAWLFPALRDVDRLGDVAAGTGSSNASARRIPV